MNADTKALLELLERSAVSQDERVNKDTRGHVWITRPDGHVFIDGSSDYHNIITCAKCGYTYCIACHDVPPKVCTK